jgi:hypothetical protein
MSKDTNLAINSSSTSTVKYSSENLSSLLEFCDTILKSGLTNFKTVEAAATAILTGQELGLPPMATIHNIHIIQGKPALGINVYTALMIKNKILYQILEDYLPQYKYERRKLVSNAYVSFTPPTVYTEDTKPLESELGTDKLVKSLSPYSYKTKIRFVRTDLLLDGKPFEITHSFSLEEAVQQELQEKENWKRMPKTMVRTRCLTSGARLIAPDLFMGVYELTEIYDTKNINYETTEDGLATEITD